MNYMRLLAFATITLFSVAACNKSEEVAEVTISEASSNLFAFVPADTPYLAGNLQAPPNEVIDTFLQRAEPVLDTVQQEMHKTREAIENENEAGTGGKVDSPQLDMPERLAHAVLQELDGKLNRAGLESLGFDLQSSKVVYGMGIFPVMRVGLSDESAFRESIQRILENAGINAPELNFQGDSYWRLSDDESFGLYIAIMQGHLAIGAFPKLGEAEFLPAFLGQSLPSNSTAAARLSELNAKHQYTPFGSGILDLNRVMDEFLSADSVLAQMIAAHGENDFSDMGPECEAEIREIVSHTPRFTVGTREFSTTAIAMQYRVETESTLAQELMGLVAEIPAANLLSKKIFEFSFGMRFGAVRDFLRTKVAAIIEDPFQCEGLQDFNDSATEAYAQLNQPMPPFVNNFRGVRLGLSELSGMDSIPESASGLAAVYVEKPEMFVGMAQMFLPDLSELSLTPGDAPVQLPETLITMSGQVAFAALSDNAIGLSLGAGEESGLISFLADEPGPAGMFLSASYDMATYLQYTQNFANQMEDYDTDGMDMDPDHRVHYQSFRNIQESAQNAFKSFADRSELTMRFTSDGFVTDSRMTFK